MSVCLASCQFSCFVGTCGHLFILLWLSLLAQQQRTGSSSFTTCFKECRYQSTGTHIIAVFNCVHHLLLLLLSVFPPFPRCLVRLKLTQLNNVSTDDQLWVWCHPNIVIATLTATHLSLSYCCHLITTSSLSVLHLLSTIKLPPTTTFPLNLLFSVLYIYSSHIHLCSSTLQSVLGCVEEAEKCVSHLVGEDVKVAEGTWFMKVSWNTALQSGDNYNEMRQAFEACYRVSCTSYYSYYYYYYYYYYYHYYYYYYYYYH